MVVPTLFTPATETLLFSFGGGGLCGYLAAKALRVMAKIVGLIIGAFILGIAFLAYKGLIDVHWQSLQSQTESFAYNATAQILAVINHTAANIHPSIIAAEGTPIAAASGFTGGLFLGLRR